MEKPVKHKRARKVLLSVLAAAVVLVAVFTAASLTISLPTKGEPAGPYANPRSALVVIDVQNDTTGNTHRYGDTASFVENVNRAVAIAGQAGMDILYVKNEYGNNPVVLLLSAGRYRRGTPGAELDGSLQVVNGNIFSKSVGDSFSSEEFERYLVSREVGTLWLAGADAAACVYSTAMGGLNRNYRVCVIEDALITVSDSVMRQMLAQYRTDGIEVVSLEQFGELARQP